MTAIVDLDTRRNRWAGPVADAAVAAWRADEAIEALAASDLCDLSCESIADHLERVARDLRSRIDSAQPSMRAAA